MQPLFFFFFEKKKMSTRHAYHWSGRFEVLDVLPRGPMDWNLGCASQRFDGVESWTCFLEVQRLNFGRASQRSDGLEFGRASQRSIEIEFGRASQRSIEIEFWTCLPEVRWFGRYYSYQCVWTFYPNTPCFDECWGWIVDLMLHHWRMWKRIIAFCSEEEFNEDFFFLI